MSTIEGKAFSSPDTTRTFPKGKVDIVKVGDFTFGRLELEPGWKWSESIKPIAATESCAVKHTGVTLSGRMKVVLDDGTEAESGPGEVYIIPPGHDAWVVGDETYVGIDFTGMSHYGVAHVPTTAQTVGTHVGSVLQGARSQAIRAYRYARSRLNQPSSETTDAAEKPTDALSDPES